MRLTLDYVTITQGALSTGFARISDGLVSWYFREIRMNHTEEMNTRLNVDLLVLENQLTIVGLSTRMYPIEHQ